MPVGIDPTTAATVAMEQNLNTTADYLQSALSELGVIAASSRPSPYTQSIVLQLQAVSNQLVALEAALAQIQG